MDFQLVFLDLIQFQDNFYHQRHNLMEHLYFLGIFQLHIMKLMNVVYHMLHQIQQDHYMELEDTQEVKVFHQVMPLVIKITLKLY